ncbi:MAG TPA: hypothetical protein VKB50_18575 [Vicinamibacterales bacterium]|nr:hypothetical protein [Vicinamibacterales bacterium]
MATISTRFTRALVYAWCLVALAPTVLTGQDALARAKDLYAAAEYAEALATLNKIENPSGIEFDQYRALCLLALGRNDEASRVIQQIVEKDPSFEPAQVSPRVQSTFRDVRRRVLPSLVRQTYADAKSAYDAGQAERAKSGFQKVIAQLDALDKLGSRESNDLRVLSTGFLDLITQTAKPVAPPTPPPQPASTPATPPEPAVYALGAIGVTPPVTVSQPMPPWHPTRQDTRTVEAVMTILIDETGAATVVSITGMLRPNYEAQLRRAVNGWKYQPATKDRVPVKYRKAVGIRLAPYGEAPQ